MSLIYLDPKQIHITTCELKSTEQLILWSLRTWVMGLIKRRCVFKEIYHAYDYYKVGIAALDLSRVLSSLSCYAKRNIDIRCPLSSHISPDELTILNMLSHYQSGNMEYADIMLAAIHKPDHLEETRALFLVFLKIIADKGKIFLESHKVQLNSASTNPYDEYAPLYLMGAK